MARTFHRWGLAAILLAAAGTRFFGIEHHLRRAAPDFDEANNFVEPVQRMWAEPTLDPTVYTGYPGFFNWLAFLPIGIGQRLGGDVGAYVGARALVAASSVASVLLAYLVARRLAGPGAGLLAAALLAVSRGEIRSAHYITPDTLVATAALALLWIAASPNAMGPRVAALLGAVGGLTVAVKYTGLFLAPGIAAAIAPDRRRLRLWLIAGLAAAAVFAVAAPYAVMQRGAGTIGAGFTQAVADYFGTGYASNRLGGSGRGALSTVLWLLFLNVGPAGLALAALGAAAFRPWRRIAPAVAIVLAGIAAMTPALLVYPRHVLAVSAVAAVLAAVGVSVVARSVGARGGAIVAAALALVVLLPPAASGLRLTGRYARPPAIDAAAAWIESRADAPWLIGTSLPRLRLDPERFEVRSTPPAMPRGALAHYPLLVLRRDEAGSWPVAAAFGGPHEERPLVITTPPRPALIEHSLRWTSTGEGGIEAVPAGTVGVERIEIEGVSPASGAVELEGREKGGTEYRALQSWLLRPGRLARQRPGAPTGQIYVLSPPVMLEALRIRSSGTALGQVRVLGPPSRDP